MDGRGGGEERALPAAVPLAGAGPLSVSAAWSLALGLAALALAATLLGNALILAQLTDPVRPADLLLDTLPYVRPARWLTVLALVVGFAVLLADLLRRRPERLPAVVCVFALMYLLRAGIMVLTPLAPAQGDQPFIFTPQQYGMFPSGHVAAMVLLAMLTPEDRPRSRAVQWLMVGLMVAGLLLARGHYSIDVVGGALLAYFVVQTWRDGRLFRRVRAVTGR